MHKIILLFSLLICNFAFSQDTIIVPTKIYILDKIQVKDGVTKIWLTESGLKSTILYVIEDNEIKSLSITYTNFSSYLNFKNQINMNSTKMSTYTKTSKSNIYKTPAGNYRARITRQGKVLSSTFTKLKEATAWVNTIKAMPLSN
jgi:hypothetical protein